MSVNDRWWTTKRGPDGTCQLIVSAEYGCAERWQVRWRDEQGRQRKQSYERKIDAETADAEIRRSITDGTYTHPVAGKITFKEYAERWRKGRRWAQITAETIESEFRIHVYPGLGDYQLRSLATRPTLIRAWTRDLQLHPNTVRKVVGNVSRVLAAATDEGIISRNPLAATRIGLTPPMVAEYLGITVGELLETYPHLAPTAFIAAEDTIEPQCDRTPDAGSLTDVDLADLLAIPLDEVHGMNRDGTGPPCRESGRYDRLEAMEWLASQDW